eukprot:3429153-Rhodomonas_salina.1
MAARAEETAAMSASSRSLSSSISTSSSPPLLSPRYNASCHSADVSKQVHLTSLDQGARARTDRRKPVRAACPGMLE